MIEEATEAQRDYLEQLIADADITWESLCDEACARCTCSGPRDPRLLRDEATELIQYLEGQ